MEKRKTDWDLVIQGNISLLWCEWCLRYENKDKTIGEALKIFSQKYENILPINVGLLLMASYLLFVYPQQTDFDNIDFDKIDINQFDVHEGTPKTDKKRFCSRIRNSLTHSRFGLHGERIEFHDQRNDETDKFRASISIKDFGNFINNFMFEVKDQHFKRKEA